VLAAGSRRRTIVTVAGSAVGEQRVKTVHCDRGVSGTVRLCKTGRFTRRRSPERGGEEQQSQCTAHTAIVP
jgi:hypothetical protein